MKKFPLFLMFFLILSSVFAQNRGFKPVNITVSGKQTQMYKQSHALVIGNSEYTSGWNVLPGVADDVEKVKTALEGNGFNVILKENLTKVQMITEIESFLTQYGYDKDNRVLIYYAGHGHTLDNNGSTMGYIVGVDAPNPNSDERVFITKSVPMSQFKVWSESTTFSKHALFMFDACFAGTIFSRNIGTTGNAVIDYNTTNFVRQFIASGTANESVPDESAFCTQFVYALQSDKADGNKDGYLTATELGEYLKNTVIYYSENTQHPQYGKIKNPKFDKGDFVFVLDNDYNLPDPDENNDLPQNMVLIKAGKFTMGSPSSEVDRDDDETQHQVTFTYDFLMGKHEVTQGEYENLMGNNPASGKSYGVGDNYPVYYVSWWDAIKYCNALSKKEGFPVAYNESTGDLLDANGRVTTDITKVKGYRLPTEAEWEYACRAETNGHTSLPFNTGSNLTTSQANYNGKYPYNSTKNENGNYRKKTTPVGSFSANNWGLYDMHGNLWEWCHDWYGDYSGNVTNPIGVSSGSSRVPRGGSWSNGAKFCRSAGRDGNSPAISKGDVGFRIARTN